MGSRNSKMRSNPNGSQVKRGILSSFMCGCSTSHAPVEEIEDNPAEDTVNPKELSESIMTKFQNPHEEIHSVSHSESESNSSTSESETISESISIGDKKNWNELDIQNIEPSNKDHCSLNREGFISSSLVSEPSYNNFSRDRNSTTHGPLVTEEQSSESLGESNEANKNAVNGVDSSVKGGDSETFHDVIDATKSPERSQDTHPSAAILGNHGGEPSTFHASNLTSTSHSLDLSLVANEQADRDYSEPRPSVLPLALSGSEQSLPDEEPSHHDVLSISSVFSYSSADISDWDARSGRTSFWDVLSRRARAQREPRDDFFSLDETDHLRLWERWMDDFSHDIFDDRSELGSRNFGFRSHRSNERRRRHRSEIRERLRYGLTENSRLATCPFRIHENGICSCNSFSTIEESSSHASISRIVMLTETLFEVLDEINHQPLPLSISIPAPESVVNSFPQKEYKKDGTNFAENNVEQCYICLSDYEEGDKIRVLPCHHEYHMACVDKWLKEIHGICPLCRREVHEASTECSAPCPEISSL